MGADVCVSPLCLCVNHIFFQTCEQSITTTSSSRLTHALRRGNPRGKLLAGVGGVREVVPSNGANLRSIMGLSFFSLNFALSLMCNKVDIVRLCVEDALLRNAECACAAGDS